MPDTSAANIAVGHFETHPYSNGSGHIMQSVIIEDVFFSSTHTSYAPTNDPHHPGIAQTKELLGWLGAKRPAVIFADCNDRPGGPVRTLIKKQVFIDAHGK